MRTIHALCVGLAVSMVWAGSALAHVDLAGGWGQRFHEDLPERGAGPDIGDDTIVKDPVYLTEPFVRTSNWVADPGFL